MKVQLSERAKLIKESSTLVITAKAKELRDAGHDIIGLGAGEPDFNTPQHIIDAACLAMNEGQTKYTASGGHPELKKEIINKLERDQGLTYGPNEIIVTTGAKHALYTLFQAIVDEGDEVIIPTPYWVSYPEQVQLAGGTPVFVTGEESNSFKITPEQLAAAITNDTKAIVINSPSNPTGMIYTKEELVAIGELCVKHNILIVSDEIYEKLIFTGSSFVSIAELSPQLKEQTIIINGVSKSHSMTGWRIGYAAGNATIIKAMTDLAAHSTSNPTTPAQFGAIAAYRESQESVEVMRQAFEERLNVIYEKFIQIPGLVCQKPQGAFYLFANAKKTAELTGFTTVDDLVKALLKEAKVAIIPGSGFGSPDYLRLSYATSLELLEEAVERIHQFVLRKMDQ